MKVRTAIGILLLTLITLGGSAAAQYPPTVGAGRVTRSDLKQCQCTQFSGDGFAPGTLVTIVDRGPSGVERAVTTVTADGKGEFKVKVCFDETAPEGQHTLYARGTNPSGGAHEDSAVVFVSGTVCHTNKDEVHPHSGTSGEDGSGEQPRTGGDNEGNGSGVGGVRLPRTGAMIVLPGLLLGFALVLVGTGAVHVSRRRRMVTG